MAGTDSATTALNPPKAVQVTVTDDQLSVALKDGRTIAVPLAWYPRLLHATPAERRHVQLASAGYGLHWPDLDEDISVEGLLLGRRSSESAASLARWLAARGKPSPHENE